MVKVVREAGDDDGKAFEITEYRFLFLNYSSIEEMLVLVLLASLNPPIIIRIFFLTME